MVANSMAACGPCLEKQVPAVCMPFCEHICQNGTLVDYWHDEKQNCDFFKIREWEDVVVTVPSYVPAEMVNTTPHCITTTTTTWKTTELIGATKKQYPSEECAVLTPGGECERIIKEGASENLTLDEDLETGEVAVNPETYCYNVVERKRIEVVQDATGHAKQLIEKTYQLCHHKEVTKEDRAGQTATEINVLGNPCPDNCDASKPGCAPCIMG